MSPLLVAHQRLRLYSHILSITHCLFAFCTVAQHSDSLHILDVVRYLMMISLHHSSKLDFLLGLSTVMSIRLRRFIFCSLPSVPTRKLWSNHGGASAPFGLYGHWRSFTRVLLYTCCSLWCYLFKLLTSGNHSFSVVKWHVRRRHPYQHGREYPKHQKPTFWRHVDC